MTEQHVHHCHGSPVANVSSVTLCHWRPPPVKSRRKPVFVSSPCHYYSIMRPIPTDVSVDHSITAWYSTQIVACQVSFSTFAFSSSYNPTIYPLPTISIWKSLRKKDFAKSLPSSLNCRQMLEECHNPQWCPRILVRAESRTGAVGHLFIINLSTPVNKILAGQT